MKVYFDESGQTGCVIKKDEILNFRDNPTFALAAVVVDEKQEKLLEKKYLDFKEKFSINGEIKGSDLLIRDNNDKLEYFLKNVLNGVNVYINIYDKRFYLSTLILFSFCGLECLEKYKYDIYTQAAILSKQDDSFFLEYLNFVENHDKDSFHNYLIYLAEYEYKYFVNPDKTIIDNVLVIMSKKILEDNKESYFVDDFMTYGWYNNKNIINLINLNCLCELVYILKNNMIKQENLIFIHDNITEFEEVIKDEMLQCGCDIQFKDSKDELMLQIADNAVSIFRHSYDKSIDYCTNNKMWEESSFWDLSLFSRLQEIIGIDRIKYTVPLSDWSASLCIKEMFNKIFPGYKRNNLFFNILYQNNMFKISNELINNLNTLNDVYNVLNE